MEVYIDNEKICRNPKVSIICLTYNCEKYLKGCLDVLVNQIADFEYEIIIHDDASTDATTEIIKSYVDCYPDKCIALIQCENQYKKIGDITETFVNPMIRGEYVSYCEGDDYWCDLNKIQKQSDFLDANMDYVACHGNYYRLNMLNNSKRQRRKGENGDIEILKLINWGGADNKYDIHVSTLMHRRWHKRFSIEDYWGPGDIKLAFELILSGKIFTSDDTYSTYRYHSSPFSWTDSVSKNVEYKIKMSSSLSKLYKVLDSETNYKYHAEINKYIRFNEARRLELLGKYDEVYLNYKDVWTGNGLRQWGDVVVHKWCPSASHLLKKVFDVLCKI